MSNEIEIIGAVKNAKVIKTKSIKLPPGAHVPLRIEISMPKGSHLNAVAPNKLKLLRTSKASLIEKETEGHYSESCHGVAIGHASIEVPENLSQIPLSGSKSSSTFFASIQSTIYFCDDLSGICSTESNVFVIPVILDNETCGNQRIILKRKVDDPSSQVTLDTEELPCVRHQPPKGTKNIEVETWRSSEPSKVIAGPIHTHEESRITLVLKVYLPEGYHFEKEKQSTWNFDETSPWFNYIKPLNGKTCGLLTPSKINKEREYRGAAGFLVNDYAEEAVFNLNIFFCRGNECLQKRLTIVVLLSVEDSAQGREHVVTVKHNIKV